MIFKLWETSICVREAIQNSQHAFLEVSQVTAGLIANIIIVLIVFVNCCMQFNFFRLKELERGLNCMHAWHGILIGWPG